MLTPSDPPGVPLIPASPTKPIRYWFEMGDQDLFYPNPTIPDGMHDWTLSAALMAKVLAERATTTSICSRATPSTSTARRLRKRLPSALEWLWKGYPIPWNARHARA